MAKTGGGPRDYEALRAHWEPAAVWMARAYERGRTKRARGSEVISALRDMYTVTSDARFLDAIAAMAEHRFDRQHAGTWRMREEQEERVCVLRMHELRVRGKARSDRQAAAMVAVAFCVRGLSFDAVTRRLVGAYKLARPTLEAREFAACFQRLGRELDKRRPT